MFSCLIKLGDIVTNVLAYFTYCPLCCSNGTIVPIESEWSGLGGKDYVICSRCGAKWHIKPSKWAKLVKTSLNGRGIEFLQKEHDPEFWQQIAY